MNSVAFAQLSQSIAANRPVAAVVLGSGLDTVADGWPCLASARFDEIPGMPAAEVAGHRGRVGLFNCAGLSLLVFQGRLHFYEGYPPETIERPIQIMSDWGIRTLLLTNAAGGIRPFPPGSLMAVREHIDAMHPNWWQNQFKSSAPYSLSLIEHLRQAAAKTAVQIFEGTYAGVTGPCYETPAEIRSFQVIGADAVGMSTVHEARVACTLGMNVAAISCIGNAAAGTSTEAPSHAAVLATVRMASIRMSGLIRGFLREVVGDQRT
jgi:purine-nucleoside phosphorylase